MNINEVEVSATLWKLMMCTTIFSFSCMPDGVQIYFECPKKLCSFLVLPGIVKTSTAVQNGKRVLYLFIWSEKDVAEDILCNHMLL